MNRREDGKPEPLSQPSGAMLSAIVLLAAAVAFAKLAIALRASVDDVVVAVVPENDPALVIVKRQTILSICICFKDTRSPTNQMRPKSGMSRIFAKTSNCFQNGALQIWGLGSQTISESIVNNVLRHLIV